MNFQEEEEEEDEEEEDDDDDEPLLELRLAGKLRWASNITDAVARRTCRLLMSLRSICGGNLEIPNMGKYHLGLGFPAGLLSAESVDAFELLKRPIF